MRSTPNGMNKSDVCILYIFLGHISCIEIFNFMESQPVFLSTISGFKKINPVNKQNKKFDEKISIISSLYFMNEMKENILIIN